MTVDKWVPNSVEQTADCLADSTAALSAVTTVVQMAAWKVVRSEQQSAA